MTTAYTWSIASMNSYPEYAGQPNVVVSASWVCVGVDGEYTGTTGGTCSFALDPAQTFTPYQDLSQQQVLTWCWASGVDKTFVENFVEQQIFNQQNPTIELPLPWGS